jgi:predicted metal-dependent HD superfamily phosphohydrolase
MPTNPTFLSLAPVLFGASPGRHAQKVMQEWNGRVEALFSQPHRHYHTLQHIQHLLDLRDQLAAQIQDHVAVTLAIFFHDLVYEVGPQVAPTHNERASAHEFIRFCADAGEAMALDAAPRQAWLDSRAKVLVWIMATADHTAADLGRADGDGQLFLDMDLAVLGESPGVYDRYAQNIQREYSWLAPPDYRKGRAAVLGKMLQSGEALYKTQCMRERFGEPSVHNLQREIARL